jgi:hypothetical protein
MLKIYKKIKNSTYPTKANPTAISQVALCKKTIITFNKYIPIY